MISLFISIALAQDARIESLKYCKVREKTYQSRMYCTGYFFKYMEEVETDNVIYQKKDTIDLCKKGWEQYRK